MESQESRDSSQQTKHNFQLLRCFCGCSQLTFEEVEALTMMNVSGLINSATGKRLLKAFLAIGHRCDKSSISITLDCYDLCERILCDISLYEDVVDDLAEVCPSYNWEQRALLAKSKSERQNLLLDLKQECLSSIECDPDFHRFRRELLRKIGK